jgi:hypothetical protein
MTGNIVMLYRSFKAIKSLTFSLVSSFAPQKQLNVRDIASNIEASVTIILPTIKKSLNSISNDTETDSECQHPT